MAKTENEQDVSTSQVEPRVPAWIDWTRSIGIAIILAMLIRWPVAEPYKIPSSSMEPTFMPGDRIFVNKHAYGVRYPMNGQRIPFTLKNIWYADSFLWDGPDVERWDIVVFKSVEPGAPHDTLVKRVVGMPGERILIRDGKLIVDGELLELPDFMPDVQYTSTVVGNYIQSNGYGLLADDEHSLIPEDHYFLLGDNSGSSRDGRWFGFMPKHHIVGEVTSIWWPLDRWRDFTGYTSRPWWTIMWALIAVWVVWRLFFGRSWKARRDFVGGLIKNGEHVSIRFSLGLPIPITGIRVTGGKPLKVGDIVFYHPRTEMHSHVEGLLGIVGGVEGDRVSFIDDQLHVNDKPVGGRFENLRYPKESDNDKYGRAKGQDYKDVPEGHVFILNQPGTSSDDSREIGFIPVKYVMGTVTSVWWPVTRIRRLKQSD